MLRRLSSIEGNSQKLDGGAMYGHAPKALWERWSPPDDRNRIDLACRALLVQEESDSGARRNVLLETGIGAFLPPDLKDRYGVVEPGHVLLDSLDAVGLSHADIDVVVLSHLHFDHAGGLLTAWAPDQPPQLLFPNARFVVGREAWQRALDPHDRDRASFIEELQPLLEASGRLEIVEHGSLEDQGLASPRAGDADPVVSKTLGPDWRFHLSWGHTPGLLLAEVPGRYGPVVFGGDLVPGRPWVHRSIHMGYDRYPELLLDEKIALLDDLVARGGRLFFTHDPTTAVARITRDEKGRYGSTRNLPRLDAVEA